MKLSLDQNSQCRPRDYHFGGDDMKKLGSLFSHVSRLMIIIKWTQSDL